MLLGLRAKVFGNSCSFFLRLRFLLLQTSLSFLTTLHLSFNSLTLLFFSLRQCQNLSSDALFRFSAELSFTLGLSSQIGQRDESTLLFFRLQSRFLFLETRFSFFAPATHLFFRS